MAAAPITITHYYSFQNPNLTKAQFTARLTKSAAAIRSCEISCTRHLLSNEPKLAYTNKVLVVDSYNQDEVQVFDEMRQRALSSRNAAIHIQAKAGNHEEVLRLFLGLLQDGITPDELTLPSVIKACIVLENDFLFEQLHGGSVKLGLNTSAIVGTGLVNGYSMFGHANDSLLVFDAIQEKDVISWNAVLTSLARCGLSENAWQTFYNMLRDEFTVDHFTMAAMLKACSSPNSSGRRAEVIHAMIIKNGYENDVFIRNSLLNMYGQLGEIESCRKEFDIVDLKRDQVSWNVVISTHAQLGFSEEAILLFRRMQDDGFKYDQFNLSSVLMAISCLNWKRAGKEVHGFLIRRKLFSDDVVLQTALIEMYTKCGGGDLEAASIVFEMMGFRNTATWNTMITGAVHHGQVHEALRLYHQMKSEKVNTDQKTYTALLTACGDECLGKQGKQIHGHILRTIHEHNVILETALVDMYAKCEKLGDARRVFDRMHHKNAYSWNVMIVAYEQHGHVNSSLALFREMQSYTGVNLDSFSLVSALSSCVTLKDLDKGKEIHGFLIRNNIQGAGSDPSLIRCRLADMYVKCSCFEYACKIYERAAEKDVYLHNVMINGFIGNGEIDKARKIFDEMEERTAVTWNTMFAGYNKMGLEDETFNLFQEAVEKEGMDDFEESTLVVMFDAVASLAALKQGKQLHAYKIKAVERLTGVLVTSAVVDMYAKCGDIDSARGVFYQLKGKNIVSWNSIIAGYAKHGLWEETFDLFKQMQQNGICPDEVTFQCLLSACSHAGIVDKGLEILNTMQVNYDISPTVEHYNCMVDLFGRLGCADDAYNLIQNMHVEPDVFTWGALMGACQVHNNVGLAKIAAQYLFELDSSNPAHFVALANIYATSGMWKEAEKVRSQMKINCVNKEPGISWIEIDDEKHTFRAGDYSHSASSEIHDMLTCLALGMSERSEDPLAMLDVGITAES